MQETAARVFEKYARAVRPELGDLLRRCAEDPALLALVPEEPDWDVPHRLAAAVDWLVDGGRVEDYRRAPRPWPAFRSAVLEHPDTVRDFLRHPVQTNEVQRCFALLPVFLAVARRAGRPLDVVELGASAGLNLLWDRYRYRYAAGTWGPADAELELSGEERGAVPGDLLRQEVAVRRRIGIDLRPLDVRDGEHVRRLRAYARPERHERLLRATEVARRDPPRLIRGDYLELLPDVLRERDGGALTVVFQTLSTIYLPEVDRARLWEIMDRAGGDGPMAYIWTPTPEEHGQRRGDYPIELASWPGGDRRIVVRMENHGEWVDWVG